MTLPVKKLLVLGLDGFDPEMGRQLMLAGQLPNLARLQGAAHCFHLLSGTTKYTGPVWEQFCSALTPEQISRWSAIHLDAGRYLPFQPHTEVVPFTERLEARTLVFDVPYFDLARSHARGLTAWGSHDPGVPETSKPEGLAAEIIQRFGKYPAPEFVYGHVWHDAALAGAMAKAMVRAVEVRSDITNWLFAERFTDWDLGITVVAEYHSATEALWHGWDETHPLHAQPSAAPAREGMLGVYLAGDRMLGRLLDEIPDAAILAFSPHGMGRNFADVSVMVLLPELLYRHFTGKTGFRPDETWALDGTGGPNLIPAEDWSQTINKRIHVEARPNGWFRRAPQLPEIPLDWMPASRYRAAWPGMRAFAMPAYAEGRIRVNLKGREGRGVVPLESYQATVDEVVTLLRNCKDAASGAPIDVEIEYRPGDPFQRDPSDADLVLSFSKEYYAFRCDGLGVIGPAPCRRPGGHTGGPGVGYYRPNGGVTASDLGSFKASELSAAVSALIRKDAQANALGAALLRAAG
jgi:predicted AlkP superfamily phosphohydrolase/phosphomutase